MSQQTTLYDTDFYVWTQEQAALLRDGKARDLDWTNLAEEMESVGASEKRTIASQLLRLLAHLLKWCYEPTHRGHSWQDSINDARVQIELTVETSPSLHTYPAQSLARAYTRARRQAHRDTGLELATFPEGCPWDIEQVLAEDFWPEG
jgi:hypothetical protein